MSLTTEIKNWPPHECLRPFLWTTHKNHMYDKLSKSKAPNISTKIQRKQMLERSTRVRTPIFYRGAPQITRKETY